MRLAGLFLELRSTASYHYQQCCAREDEQYRPAHKKHSQVEARGTGRRETSEGTWNVACHCPHSRRLSRTTSCRRRESSERGTTEGTWNVA